MKEKMKSVLRHFDLGAFLSVLFLMGGGALLVIGIALTLYWEIVAMLWLLVPGILSIATAAGLAL